MIDFDAKPVTIRRGMPAGAGVLAAPNPVSINEAEVHIQVCAGGPGEIKVAIYSQLGVLVDKMEGSVHSPDGVRVFSWDLCDMHGRRVLPGTYLAIARVTSLRTGGQAEYRTKIGVSR